jgi:hypothetical protein
VKSRTEWILVCLASAAVALITLAPYAWAARLVPDGTVFSGFLINPVDGYSYLAKMRQGLEGAWTFTLPYLDSGPGGAAVFVYYLFLGHIAGLLDTPLLSIYQGARLVNGFVMYVSVYALLTVVLPDRRPRWLAFALILAGSGLGWLGVAAGLEGTDLLVPESIPFVTVFTNPHFPLALALVALGAWMIVGDGHKWWRSAGALVVGGSLGMVLPFAIVPILVGGSFWIVWQSLGSRTGRDVLSGVIHQRSLLPLAALGLGALPWVGYDFWLVSKDPVFAAWNAQNQTPSPPPWDYVLGFGFVLIWALVAVWRSDVIHRPSGRFLVAWAAINGLALYIPFNLQRRFSLGLFVPLAALAGIGLARTLGAPGRRGGLTLALILLLSLPSNVLVVGAGLATAASGSPLVTETSGEAAAYAWLGDHAAHGAVVLSATETGIRLPAQAPVTVIAGHPFETPDFESRAETVQMVFGGETSDAAVSELLASWRVDYVFYGPYEKQLGPKPNWLADYEPVFQSGGVTVYSVGPA